MNIYLLNSSIFFGYVHMYYAISLRFWPLYMNFLTLGITSSIFNHAFTDRTLQLIDRGLMFTGFIMDLAILLENSLYDRYAILIIELFAVLFYGCSKKYNSTKLHILSHAIITFSHCSIISSAYFACRSLGSVYVKPQYIQLLCQ